MLLAISNTLIATPWLDLYNAKTMTLKNNPSYNIIQEQWHAYNINESPSIANPVIKSIKIIDNGEELIDVRDMTNARICMLPDSPENKPFSAAIYNSGLPNASKMRIDIYHKLEKMLFYLDKLAPLFGYTPGSIAIKIFEGLRDLATQEMLFLNKFNEIKSANPALSDDDAEIETAKWVSPVKNNVPVHSTGAAVDIRLWNENTGDFIDVGKFGVIWGINNEAQTFCENITDTQKLNRLYLLMAATKAGLTNYVYEHWHFSAGDRYAAYWQKTEPHQKIAYYGAINL
jgi:D-alanyl-D-alanine dipeptidase